MIVTLVPALKGIFEYILIEVHGALQIRRLWDVNADECFPVDHLCRHIRIDKDIDTDLIAVDRIPKIANQLVRILHAANVICAFSDRCTGLFLNPEQNGSAARIGKCRIGLKLSP